MKPKIKDKNISPGILIDGNLHCGPGCLLFNNLTEGFAWHKIVLGKKGRPCDYIFLEVNSVFEQLTGLKRENIIGRKVTKVLPGIDKDPTGWIKKYGKVAMTGKPCRFESYAAPFGKWYSVSAFSPEKEYFAVIFSDITEQKRSLEIMRASEERLKRAEKIGRLGSWELNLINNKLTWSDEAYRIFGLKPQQFAATYEAFLKTVHPDDRKMVDKAYLDSLNKGRNGYEIEHRILRQDGKVLTVREKGRHFRDKSGKIIRSVGMVQDITESREIEERLQHLASFPQLNPNPIVELDLNNNINYLNPAAKKIFPNILKLKNKHPFLKGWKKSAKALFSRRQKVFTRDIKAGNFWYAQTITYLPQKQNFRIYSHNITNNKEAEEKIKKLNKALMQERNIIKALMENTEAQLAYLDKDFIFIDVNAAYEKGSRHKREELIGKNHFALFPNAENERIFKKVRNTGKRAEFKAKPFIFKDQPERGITYWNWTLIPIKGDQGELIGLVLSLLDITEIKQREENLKKYLREIGEEKARSEALLESIGEAIIAVDGKGKVLFANSAFYKLARINEKEAKNKKITDILPLYNKQKRKISGKEHPFFLSIQKKGKLEGGHLEDQDFYWLAAKGKEIPVSFTAAPIILWEKVIGSVLVFHDMTKDFETDRAKTEFISMAAHQLRTPLTTMNLTLEMLLRGFGGEISKEVKGYLSDFSSDIQTMTQLIKTFLNVSRLDLGTLKVNIIETDIGKTADDILKSFIQQIRKKRLKVKRSYSKKSSFTIKTDPKIFSLAIENIIENAVKYTPPKGEVSVKITRRKTDFIVEVSDTGPGIPESEQKSLFTKFYRANNGLKEEGTGLGLYIAKYSIEKLRGKIWFKSKLNKGTSFFISLPFSPKKQKGSL